MTRQNNLSVDRIFHPTDFSDGSDLAFVHALRLACALKATLSILHVHRHHHTDWNKYPAVRETLCRWKLLPPDASRSDVSNLGISVSKAAVADRNPADGILSYLDTHHSDLLVLATHQRHGLDRWMHQHVAEKVNRATDGATLFIPYGSQGFVDEQTGVCRLNRILLPVDHIPNPSPAVRLAAGLTTALDSPECEIRLLHIGSADERPTIRFPADTQPQFKWVTRNGPAVEGIVEEARSHSSDLIIMATSGRHGLLDAIRGSTTEQILQYSPCPVLAVHSPDE